MSAIPSRTRSLRKPTDTGSNRYGRPPVTQTSTTNARETGPRPIQRSSQSPSRLPIKPSTRTTATSSRPPSSNGNTTNNAATRPPPSRANIGKLASGGMQKPSSNQVPNTASSAEPVKQDRSRPPITTSRHMRNPSAGVISASTRVPSHTRTQSSSTILSASTILRPPTREEAGSRSTQGEPQVRRPAFSTLQQHFSPAKSLAPKPHPAAFLAPPSPSKLPSNIAISAETAKLQNELLQLHLLHRGVAQVENQWRLSAKRTLGSRFQAVMDRNDAVMRLEAEETGKNNAAALQRWEDMGTPGWGLEEKIQTLDEVLTGVWIQGESGGKYTKVVRKFERWLNRCQAVLETRVRDDEIDDNYDEMMFIEELDHGWRDDCHVLGRKLETWRGHLNDLGSPECGSNLATIADGCRSLIRGMLTELSVMGQIERDTMSVEADWIKTMNHDILDNDSNDDITAAWRIR